ncbi:glycoside hydrolase family 61 protein [Gymnopilus junonius]|uniref:lytic cellulose monooxygenase (C4-dehydrogenating) n=1 Tax=Gymnopilus junonius TaxID=109634 RepID=A0A9P5TGU5_GYMJU|nr:glycoside hydrolase family 61 protein [Gymnopilus junonius]KAF8883097.1 glycoside hydrolase family 61 protein [Gymnopilus junonius]
MLASVALLSGLACQVAAHYTFPNLILNGQPSTDWQYIRQTDNYEDLSPLTDVTSPEFTCYDTSIVSSPSTASVAAGSTIGFQAYGNPSSLYHPGVVNVYMAKATGDVSEFTGGSGAVWFKVYEITAVTDGGESISFPAENLPSVSFTIPTELPSGQYLVRMEALAIHSASYYGGAQFYVGCAQVEVTGGGSGTPGPLVAIPGVYTGYEPGILVDIYYPIPANYTQPGPPVWPPS